MAIVIVGFTNDDKVPGAFGETKFGQGNQSIGANPVVLLVVGNMLVGGSATVDQDVVDIFEESDAEAAFGASSELANMCYAALEIPGVTLKAAPVTDAGGAVAATAVLTVGGTWSTAGEFSFWLGGKKFNVGVGSAESVTDVGDNIDTAVNADPHIFCTSANAVGTVTLTVDNVGARGNQHIAHLDASKIPTGMTLTLTGGTPLTGGLVPFNGGTAVDDVTAVLAVLFPGTYDYQAWAQNDTTNAQLIRAQADSKAGPLEGRLEFYGFHVNGNLTAATALGQTDINDQRGEVSWLENHEAHPSRVVSVINALRSVTDPAQPNSNYDNAELPGLPPQRFEADRPGHATKKSALNNSVTPLLSSADGRVSIVRGITTKSLDGANPDFRTLDWAEAVVPDRIRKELVALWLGTFQPANPFVGPDPGEGEEPIPPEGMATPSLWNSEVENFLRSRALPPFLWVTQIDSNLPESEFNEDAERIMSAVPVKVTPQQHQIGISVRQVA